MDWIGKFSDKSSPLMFFPAPGWECSLREVGLVWFFLWPEMNETGHCATSVRALKSSTSTEDSIGFCTFIFFICSKQNLK